MIRTNYRGSWIVSTAGCFYELFFRDNHKAKIYLN